uniref:Uncharacterized protein n=1 Tax=Anguilla anguilla TaxID=7936 RepID=A0A0E9UN78_ANGAN
MLFHTPNAVHISPIDFSLLLYIPKNYTKAPHTSFPSLFASITTLFGSVIQEW